MVDDNKVKRYPFSTQKHAHDVEFRRNRVKNIMSDMESGEIAMDEKAYEKLSDLADSLTDLLLAVMNSRDGYISYLTGPQIGLAKETVLWAAETRAATQQSKKTSILNALDAGKEKVEKADANRKRQANAPMPRKGRGQEQGG